MFQHINKLLRGTLARAKRKKPPLSNKGQVAIVMLLLIALALVAYAVSLNIGRAAQTKTITTISSNVGAAQLGSQMASYGQAVFKTQLGGKLRVCGWTGIFAAILAIIVIVISIITFNPSGFAFALSILGLALSVLALAIQIAYVQPGITSLWNKIAQANLSQVDQFLEQALRSGLQNVVTDTKQVPDMDDSDLDRLWGTENGLPKDEVSRYGKYYSWLLSWIERPDTAWMEEFVCALKDTVFIDPPQNFLSCPSNVSADWGMFDPWDPNLAPWAGTCPDHACCFEQGDPDPPAQCNPCCLPPAVENPLEPGTTISLLPDCCNIGVGEECGNTNQCGNGPYTDPVNTATVNGTTYTYVYEPFWENDENNPAGTPLGSGPGVSFREALGRDDEHEWYRKFRTGPNGPQQAQNNTSWEVGDTTGFYSSPHYTTNPDDLKGVFPLFYKIRDWGMDLSDAVNAATFNRYCYWYDPNEPNTPCSGVPMNYNELANSQLALPLETGDLRLTINRTPQVDWENPSWIQPGEPTLVPDKIALPAGILAQDNVCAQNILGLGQFQGFWKSGADRFCNDGDRRQQWPYYADCAKCANAGEDCLCSDSPNPSLFVEDSIDDIVYGMDEFFLWAIKFINEAEADVLSKVETFEDWFEEAARWICDASAFPDACSEDGALVRWRDELSAMLNRFIRYREEISYAGATCTEVWCVPPDGGAGSTCPEVPDDETTTIDFNNNNVKGDLEDVEACLNYNIEGYDFVNSVINPVGTNQGNDFRFNACAQECTDVACSGLPRSLIPPAVYNPQDFQPPAVPLDQPDLAPMLNCFYSCNQVNCQNLPLNHAGSGAPYIWPGNPQIASWANECGVGLANWDSGNPWFTAIRNNIDAINASCTPDAGQNFASNANGEGSAWIDHTRRSAWEAENQVAKFKTRRDFLSARLGELNNAIDIFDAAVTQLDQFLTNQAADVVREYLSPSPENTYQFPKQVIYGWQSDPPEGRQEGYWHIVKVEARLPGRCDELCTSNQEAPDPGFPRVVTYTKKWGTKRCYELVDLEGSVKFRTTRWDEDRDPSSLLFPNGVPIWDFRSFHPERGAPNLSNVDIGFTCTNQSILEHPDPNLPPTDAYKGAFIMQQLITSATQSTTPPYQSNESCWNLTNKLLTYGVVSETCAQYYYKEGERPGFDFRFVPCRPF